MSKLYEEERLLLHVQEAIAEAIERSGYTKSDIARHLGVNRSVVTHALDSGRNLSLAVVAGLAWSAGFRIKIGIEEAWEKPRNRKSRTYSARK